MSDAPLVSIIITNYNYGRYLREAIESGLSQTYNPNEVIVVDDGSSDDSREIIASYGDRIIPYLKENGGQASAFNSGFALSKGEIVIFLDADDMLLPDTCRRVVEAFRAAPQVVKVMYRMEIIDADSTRTGKIKPPPHLPLRSGDLARHVLTFPFDMTWMATSGNAFASWVLARVLPMPEEPFRILADYYLSHITALFGQVYFLDDIGANYRIHASNNYESSTPSIDLSQIRQTLVTSSHTHTQIRKFANQLGLSDRPKKEDDLLSVSLLTKRLVSLKLDPGGHPIKEDNLWRLFLLGSRASLRRFDVSLPMKILFLLWFVIMALVPRAFVPRLAARFSFPENRGPANKLLRSFHVRV